LVPVAYRRLVVMLAIVVPPGESTENLPRDLVVCSASGGIYGTVAPDDTVVAHESSSTIGQSVSGLYMLDSPSCSSQPINWRWVENEAESVCS
jgi:hypothetical protein